jgi:hypothetical protein
MSTAIDKTAVFQRLRSEGRWPAFQARQKEILASLMERGQAEAEATDNAYKLALTEFGPDTAPKKQRPPTAAQTKSRAAAARLTAKETLWRSAGTSEDLSESVRWALKWSPMARGEDGEVQWEKIRGEDQLPPGKEALTFLEMAVLNNDQFLKGIVPKYLEQKAADEGLDEGSKRYERRREEELLRLLDELDRELAAA